MTFEAGPAAPELRVSRVEIDEHAPAKPPRHRLQSQVPAQIHEKRGLVGNPMAPPSNGELAEEDTVVPTKGKRQTAATE